MTSKRDLTWQEIEAAYSGSAARRLARYALGLEYASLPAEVIHAAKRCLLDALGWHGVAMVEFKREEATGRFVLMEVNPKFWGSLELAIVSGVDFPYLASRMAVEGEIDPVLSYREGVRFRWLLPLDLFHAITNPPSIPRFLADFADLSIHSDLDLRDPLPGIMQAGMTLAEAGIRLKEGRFWRPHGSPRL